MHCVSTATFGAFLGYAKFKDGGTKAFLTFVGLCIAMFIHFAWNFSVSFESTQLLGFLFMIITVAIFIIVYNISIMSERKIIYNELKDEANRGLIPVNHLNILNSNYRNTTGWIDESIRKLYVRAATTLAFRKMELRKSKGESRSYYERDIEYYRNFISSLLAKQNYVNKI